MNNLAQRLNEVREIDEALEDLLNQCGDPLDFLYAALDIAAAVAVKQGIPKEEAIQGFVESLDEFESNGFY